ncbi:MAG: PLP-dependent transferase [Bacteriovoracaceae bacterium]|nr:PLP-dependent transferase [Bacteriovoracaceae bacterium]
MSKYQRKDIATKVIHAGAHADKETGAVTAPIYQTSTYVQSSPGKHQGFEYTRSHNPTRTRLEECLAAIENGKFAIATASGMSATTLLMHMLPKDSTVICGDDVYGGTYRLFTTVFKNTHRFIFTDTTNTAELKKIIQKEKPQLLWLETPTNPMLKITDLAVTAEIAKAANVITVVDNTFMSPYFQNPLNLGIDIVVHSMTKYINGHSDVVGGAIILNKKSLYDQLWVLQNSIGPSQSPFDSWLVLRGIKTLAVRMRTHEANAKLIAEFLEKHKMVEKVIYPGLPSHPQHEIAKKQMKGFGGMITFFIKGGIKNSRKFLETVELFSLAESLGGVESLIEHPAIMTHASVPAPIREKLGIKDNLVRISVGIEDAQDLINDLKNALKAISN